MEDSTQHQSQALACSNCFRDQGLRLDSLHFGVQDASPCPWCGSELGLKLSRDGLLGLAYRYFRCGTMYKFEYGEAPVVVFNDAQETSIALAPWLEADVKIFEKQVGIGFFYYGPRLWMVGEVEPLKDLQRPESRAPIVARIMREYPCFTLSPGMTFYRVRKAPARAANSSEYDSPPVGVKGAGRLDSPALSVLYGSPDLELCVHECRTTADDEIFAATLDPRGTLRLLDLTAVLPERVTEFESLDIAVNMLFLAKEHSYEISREIGLAARAAGFDGIQYPSYFSLLRTGAMPSETTYGISHRRIPELAVAEKAKVVPNVALFGRPIEEGKLEVQCINRVYVRRVEYELSFGPVGYESNSEVTELGEGGS